MSLHHFLHNPVSSAPSLLSRDVASSCSLLDCLLGTVNEKLSLSQRCRWSPWEQSASNAPPAPSLSACTRTHIHIHTLGAIGGQQGPCPSCFWVQLLVSPGLLSSGSAHSTGQLLSLKWGVEGGADSCNSSASCADSRPQGLALESSVGTSRRLYHSPTPPQTPVTWRKPKSMLASCGSYLFLEAGDRGQRCCVHGIALGCQGILAEVSHLWSRWCTSKCRAKRWAVYEGNGRDGRWRHSC